MKYSLIFHRHNKFQLPLDFWDGLGNPGRGGHIGVAYFKHHLVDLFKRHQTQPTKKNN